MAYKVKKKKEKELPKYVKEYDDYIRKKYFKGKSYSQVSAEEQLKWDRLVAGELLVREFGGMLKEIYEYGKRRILKKKGKK